MDCFLGLDVGTTAVKALVVDLQGNVHGEASREYAYSQPRPGWVEQNATDWWDCLVDVIIRATQGLATPPSALSLSTQGDTMVPVDADGLPMAAARVWMDRRGAQQVARLHERISQERWTAITGSALAEYAGAVTLAWWADEMPDVFASAHRFCMVEDYLVGRLCGSYVIDAPNASRSLLVDLHSRDWSDELLAAVGVGRDRLATVAESGVPAGTLRPKVAELLHLPPETLVVVGAHDQTAGAVGCGAVAPGTVMLATGTAWVLLGASTTPHMGGPLQTYCHAMPGGIAVLAAYAGGVILRWARDTFYLDACGDLPDYDRLTEEALEAEGSGRGELVLLPHFYGSGPPWGRRYAFGAFAGLRLQHNRGDIILGLLRGVAAQTAAALETMTRAGYEVDALRMIGGGARSEYWAQLVADASGHPVSLPSVTEAAALGAAMLAAIGAGALPDVHAAGRLIAINHHVQPRANAGGLTPASMGEYVEALDATWRALADYHASRGM